MTVTLQVELCIKSNNTYTSHHTYYSQDGVVEIQLAKQQTHTMVCAGIGLVTASLDRCTTEQVVVLDQLTGMVSVCRSGHQ